MSFSQPGVSTWIRVLLPACRKPGLETPQERAHQSLDPGPLLYGSETVGSIRDLPGVPHCSAGRIRLLSRASVMPGNYRFGSSWPSEAMRTEKALALASVTSSVI